VLSATCEPFCLCLDLACAKSKDAMAKYSPIQPKDGDCCLLCKHAREQEQHLHWFEAKGLVVHLVSEHSVMQQDVVRPKWIVLCEQCFMDTEGDPRKALLTDLVDWAGDDPVIMAPN
jgi:hypothetical protein